MLLGEYKVLEKMGSGSMGDVFLGQHCQTNQKVAIKIISSELIENSSAIARFKREIYQTIQLDHPNIVSGYTAGEFQGRLYYAMEYVNGLSVRKELLNIHHYEENKALRIALQVAKALEHASSYKIVHRDIKPDNILLTKENLVKLCDLGLAKSLESNNKHTLTGTVLGSPNYMSPEQTLGKDLSEQSDMFSLGTTLYQMLTGYLPFKGKDYIEIMTQVQELKPVKMQEWNPLISDHTCKVVEKMMHKEPQHRYSSFTELCSELEQSIVMNRNSSIKAKYGSCYVPSFREVTTAKIALHNNILNPDQLEHCMQQQEQLYLVGVHIPLEEIILENKFLAINSLNLLRKTTTQFINQQINQILKKTFPQDPLTHKEDILYFSLLKKINQDQAMQRKASCTIKNNLFQQEQKAILKIGSKYNIFSKIQADKCWNIYANKIVLHEYNSIIEILANKNYAHENDSNMILRAIRKNTMTKFPIEQFMEEQKF